MTDQELHNLIEQTLFEVAPDLEGETIDPDRSFMDQFDLDSMDFLNFVIGLHKATEVEIPEADYPQISSMSDCVSYLKSRGWAGCPT